MAQTFELAVYIGRFQPFHNGHLAVVREGLTRAARLLIIIGSADMARRPDLAPFTADERAQMILASLTPAEQSRVTIRAVPDMGDLTRWAHAVRRVVDDSDEAIGRVAVIGCRKDRSSGYLDAFAQWPVIEAPLYRGLSACDVRAAYFGDEAAAVDDYLGDEARRILPGPVVDWLAAFRQDPAYADMVEEAAFAARYHAAWSQAPYPPVFVTADAVVVKDGRVLLIRRKSRPGKGLWALPGGFVEQDEYILDAALRELREETGLTVSDADLRRSAVATRVFDAPQRDIRGRMVTHATLFRLSTGGDLPLVAADDDAAAAEWVPLNKLRREGMFSDHFIIIQTLTALLKAAD